MQLSGVCEGSGLQDGARTGHHGPDELATHSKETPEHVQSLGCVLSDLMYANRPGQL